MAVRTIEWTNGRVVMIDQRLLPTREVYRVYSHYREVAAAIKDMVIRGAPAIGVAAAMGIALGARGLKGDIERAAAEFAEARRLVADDRYASITRLRAVEPTGVPKLRALFEATYFAGLRKIGLPEE